MLWGRGPGLAAGTTSRREAACGRVLTRAGAGLPQETPGTGWKGDRREAVACSRQWAGDDQRATGKLGLQLGRHSCTATTRQREVGPTPRVQVTEHKGHQHPAGGLQGMSSHTTGAHGPRAGVALQDRRAVGGEASLGEQQGTGRGCFSTVNSEPGKDACTHARPCVRRRDGGSSSSTRGDCGGQHNAPACPVQNPWSLTM